MGGNPPLSDELAREAVEALRQYGSKRAAADALGIERCTLYTRLNSKAARKYLNEIVPDFRVTKRTDELSEDGTVTRQFITQAPERGEEFHVPAGHKVKGVSALVDADGRVVQQWLKTREGELDPAAIVDWFKTAFVDVPPADAAAPPLEIAADDLLTLIPCNDWHIGQFSWGQETSENWDLKIAEATIGAAIEDVIRRTPPSGTAIVLGGGDLLHADNKTNQTAHSGNQLDVDGRYQKVLMTGCRLMVRTIDASLAKHQHTIVRILPGNHDEHSAVAAAYFLLAWYRNEPRVTVDADPSLFFWHRFGKVLLGATHGHTVKIAKMPAIMAHRKAEDWGVTKHRFVHGFHLHHGDKGVSDEGVMKEIHQAPVPPDAWHWGCGFLSGRSVQAITYHAELGEYGRVRTAILDGAG